MCTQKSHPIQFNDPLSRFARLGTVTTTTTTVITAVTATNGNRQSAFIVIYLYVAKLIVEKNVFKKSLFSKDRSTTLLFA